MSPHILSSSSHLNPISEPIFPISLKHCKPIHFSTTIINSNDKNRNFIPKISTHTAPWMKSPLVLEPNQVLELSISKLRSNKKKTDFEKSLTQKVSGGRGKKAMKKIFQGIEKLQENGGFEKYPDGIESGEERMAIRSRMTNVFEGSESVQENDGFEGIKKSPDEFEFGFSLGKEKGREIRRRMPWETDEKVVLFRRMKREKVERGAELVIDGVLLKRLRSEAARIRKWVKVMKSGVTDAVVDQVFSTWQSNELAMIKFDIPLCRNMERAREIVELKTGGVVVWCKKDVLVVYRGCNYELRFSASENLRGSSYSCGTPSNDCKKDNFAGTTIKSGKSSVDVMCGWRNVEDEMMPVSGSLYEREADRLLEGLGPRFIDWWRPKPLPVDGDLLPETVPGFKPPLRLCPLNARAKLTDVELTYFRKLAYNLPTHFVLGRNRKLQGTAAAIIKLWEKCHIAKIAVKWGIPNTKNVEMATELKFLTGGVLLLRNKFFIILYRGKDFLSPVVANLVVEREMELRHIQCHEEAARVSAIGTLNLGYDLPTKDSTVGTLSEFQDIQSERGGLEPGSGADDIRLQSEKARLEKDLRNQEHKLYILKTKIEKASSKLAKINSSWSPSEPNEDHEMLTEEERQCFRKIGLKMGSKLILGRRGVFDGVLEGLHQHWKLREIAKVITMQTVMSKIIYTAKLLEAESGGILVSVAKLKEGHGIIIYRGKNYRRPLKSQHQNLLNKRKALSRSLELQRIGSLKFFAHMRQQAINDLKLKLANLEE